MSKLENSIGWCDDTGNKVIGCSKVSEGCKNCYAEVGTIARVLRSRAENPVETWGAAGQRIAVGDFSAKLRRLNRLCLCDCCHETYPLNGTASKMLAARCPCGGPLRRIRLFADSNSDWLDERWPIETFAEFLDELRRAPNVDVLLLTKRIDGFVIRMESVLHYLDHKRPLLKDDSFYLWVIEWLEGKAPSHFWIGVSVENQKRADERRIGFESIPARMKYVSYEPALEVVDWLGWEFLDWMIAGLESGKNRRDGGIRCVTSAVDYCTSADIPIYVKQDCAFKSGQQGRIPAEIWRLKQFPRGEVGSWKLEAGRL